MYIRNAHLHPASSEPFNTRLICRTLAEDRPGKVGLKKILQTAAESPLWRRDTSGALSDGRSPRGSDTYGNRSALNDGLKYNQRFFIESRDSSIEVRR